MRMSFYFEAGSRIGDIVRGVIKVEGFLVLRKSRIESNVPSKLD
jgi:hypothetical protein